MKDSNSPKRGVAASSAAPSNAAGKSNTNTANQNSPNDNTADNTKGNVVAVVNTSYTTTPQRSWESELTGNGIGKDEKMVICFQLFDSYKSYIASYVIDKSDIAKCVESAQGNYQTADKKINEHINPLSKGNKKNPVKRGKVNEYGFIANNMGGAQPSILEEGCYDTQFFKESVGERGESVGERGGGYRGRSMSVTGGGADARSSSLDNVSRMRSSSMGGEQFGNNPFHQNKNSSVANPYAGNINKDITPKRGGYGADVAGGNGVRDSRLPTKTPQTTAVDVFDGGRDESSPFSSPVRQRNWHGELNCNISSPFTNPLVVNFIIPLTLSYPHT